MKLEIYEPHKVGYVSLDPYEWEYNGRYDRVELILSWQREYQKYLPIEEEDLEDFEGEVQGEREVVLEDREYLMALSRDLKANKVWETKIVEDG